jgi:hypothetical protein
MPDEVFNKSIQAVGGAQRAGAVTGFVAAGTNVGCGPESADKRKTEIYSTAMPLRRTRVVHTSNGDATTTFNGTSAWCAAPLRPVDNAHARRTRERRYRR